MGVMQKAKFPDSIFAIFYCVLSNANKRMARIFLFLYSRYSFIRANRVKNSFILLTLILLTGCNFPAQKSPAFVAPSEYELAATPTAENTPIPSETPSESEASAAIEPGSPTPEAAAMATPIPTETPIPAKPDGPLLYYTQAGDTLAALSVRFGVRPDEIESTTTLPARGFINPNQLLIIPQRFTNTTSSAHLLPDSEIVYTLSAIDFNAVQYVNDAGGYLQNAHDYFGSNGEVSGAEIVYKTALDNSINPRLLLALLEFQSGWVFGQPATLTEEEYPLGHIIYNDRGLADQLKWAVNQLSIGYYGWREGRLSEITFTDGITAHLAPDLNAGTAALQYYFAQIYDSQTWLAALDTKTGLPAIYEQMFGSPWMRAQVVEPLFPPDIEQPELELPFIPERTWSYTGGPHGAWEKDGSWAAIDFAPATSVSGCVRSDAWVTAVGDGIVTRAERGIVVLDLDGDGFEQTGWVMIYLHIATEGRTGSNRVVKAGDLLGHPSCEGGHATGTHVHIARKYNGEWIAADGPIPFTLSGWAAHSAGEPYKGTLTQNGETITASQYGAGVSVIMLEE